MLTYNCKLFFLLSYKMTELTIQQKYRVKDIGIIIFLSIVAILLGIFIPVENYFQLVCKIVVVIILLI
jgi:hypothetical protein